LNPGSRWLHAFCASAPGTRHRPDLIIIPPASVFVCFQAHQMTTPSTIIYLIKSKFRVSSRGILVMMCRHGTSSSALDCIVLALTRRMFKKLRQPSWCQYSTDSRPLPANAKGSVVAAVACYDTVFQRVDDSEWNGEDYGENPTHCHQREHGSGDGEATFSCSTLESIGAVNY
jgi:hypothetical protein